uniref:Uncharacterized protein n=1 Tax=Strigamia maritima TaxID=126957 RepID=T1IJX3_STRMM
MEDLKEKQQAMSIINHMTQEKQEKQEAIRPRTSQKLLDGGFEGKTTSSEHYQSHATERTQLIKPLDETHVSTDPFDSSTTAKQDYPEWEVQPRERRMIQEYVKPKGEFESQTTNTLAYMTQEKQEKREAIRPRTSQKLLDGGFEGKTTSNEHYQSYATERTQLIKPLDETHLSTDPFDSSTTAKQDYPEWEVQPREKRKTQEYVKPEGEFERKTTNTLAYMAQGSPERREAIRPRTSQKLLDGGFDSSTTAKRDYPEWEVQPREKRKTQEYIKPEGEFESQTTNTLAYMTQEKQEKREAIRPITSQKLLDGGFDSSTTAKRDYPEWEVQPREKRKTQKYVKPDGKFEDTTTNVADYGATNVEKRQAIRPKASELNFEGDFQANTTSKEHFKAYEGGKAQSIRHKDELVLADAAFQDATTVKSDYPEWEIQPREKRKTQEYVKPDGEFESQTTNTLAYMAQGSSEKREAIRPKSSQKLLDGDFEGTTTSNEHFRAHQGEKARTIRHKDELVLAADAAFQDATTVKNDYPEWEVQPREKRKTQEYVKPEGKFEASTTSNSDYTSLSSGERTRAIRPKSSEKMFDGQFIGTTSNNDYGLLNGEKRRAIRPKTSEKLNDGKFDGTTTSKTDYAVSNGERRQAIRPKTSEMLYGGQFEGTTTSNDSFQALQGEKTQSIRHKDQLVLAEDPFQDATTVKSDYPEWEVQPREKLKRLDYVKPEGKFEDTTTSKSDYAVSNGERRQAIRPRTSEKLYDGQFVGTTTSNDSFQALLGEKTQSIRHKDEIVLADGTFQDATTAKTDYPAWGVQPRDKRKQAEYIKPDGLFDDTTTNKVAFIGKGNGEKREAIRPKTSQKLLDGGFEGVTTSKDAFQSRGGQRAHAIRPHDSTVLSTDRFVGSTTANQDYTEWKVEGRQRRKHEEYVKPDGEFYSSTTNRSEFKTVPLEKTQAFRPAAHTLMSGQFDGTTTHKSAFTNIAAERTAIIKPTTSPVSSNEPFDGTTTQKAHYVGAQQADSQKPQRRRTLTKIADDPFEGETSNSRDYKKWEVKTPSPRIREVYVKPEGDMNMITTQMAHYTDSQSNQRTRAVRPHTNTKLGEGPFEGSTTSRGDYKEWMATSSRKLTVVQEYKPPTHKFSATTTNMSDYPAYATGNRAKAVKNVGSSIKLGNDDSPFAGGTSYNSQYLANTHICPVSLFGTEKSSYQYKSDVAGHKFYNPLA